MLVTVQEFLQRTRHGLPDLVHDLQEETLRLGREEEEAWTRSLPRLAVALDRPSLQSFHLHLGERGGLSLEYRLPASSSWCDVVLLGRGPAQPAAVVVELKDWETRGDQPGSRPGLIRHFGVETLHPSEQVRGYVDYCQRFHSTIQEAGAAVHGCVFMTSATDLGAYHAAPHEELVARFPVFPFRGNGEDLAVYLQRLLVKPAPDFAEAFEHGTYRQDRHFVEQVAKTLRDPADGQFVLLDNQRLGFEHCLDRVDRILDQAGADQKAVVIIDGPPGSGKSVLAAHLWAELAQDKRLRNNLVFTTTSSAQKSNWQALFRQAGGGPAGAGIVMPANQYNPGLTTQWVKRKREAGFTVEVETWRQNLELFARSGKSSRMPDDSLAVSIIDEAHALMDPTAPGARGTPPSGWTIHAGPQAFHIIRASRLSIFLMDADQSYRDNERTTAETIERYASELGVRQILRVSLAGAQFRCAGAKEYMDWLDGALGLRPHCTDLSWRKDARGKGRFVFEMVQDPFALEDRLRSRIREDRTARLIASYARPWKTKGHPAPHALPAGEQDFHIMVPGDSAFRDWSRPWNFAPNQDYTVFIQAPAVSRMAEDPLAEVGCPYIIRGFDYDYLGLLWLSDLVWRGDRWKVQLDHVHETAWKITLGGARREKGSGPRTEELLNRLIRGYRILLTRAIHGLYLWVEDEETREHLSDLLSGSHH